MSPTRWMASSQKFSTCRPDAHVRQNCDCLNPRPPAAPIHAATEPIAPLPPGSPAHYSRRNVSRSNHPPGRLGRKYLTAEERCRFLEAAARARQPTDPTFALTLAHTGARVSETLAIRPADVDLEAASIRIRHLKTTGERP